MNESDPTPTTKVTTPPPAPTDPNVLLKAMQNVVDNNKSPDGGGKSWVSTLIILGVVVVAAAVWAWVSWSQGRELAGLRHEKEKARILNDQAIVDAAVQSGDKKVVDLQKGFDAAAADIEQLTVAIRNVEAQRAADQQAIDRITSWRRPDPGVPPNAS
jgi:uncharacterized protein HemX